MSKPISLKITIDNEANYLFADYEQFRGIADLDRFSKSCYQELQKNVDEFRYYWIDEDGDEIRVSMNEDFRNFLLSHANAKARLYVVDKKTNTTAAEPAEPEVAPMQSEATGTDVSSRPVHQYAICDVCDETIVGHRYKCLTCHDYDLCMSCEAKFRHKDHLMLRIPKPSMVNRSHMVSRMLDKLRTYSVRINNNAEKDEAAEAETFAPADNVLKDSFAAKCDIPRCLVRGEPIKPSPYRHVRKAMHKHDRKQTSASAGETSGERNSKEETKEKRSGCKTSDMTQCYRAMMLSYLNSFDAAEKPDQWSTRDHVAVANVAAATATAAAARASAMASKVMKAMSDGKSQDPSQETAQQKPATPVQQPSAAAPATPPMMPLPYLPFINLAWPTQEKLMLASENVSKLLDPLGLSFEIRHKSTAAATTTSSNSSGSAKACDGEDDGAAVQSTSANVASPIPTTSTVETGVPQQQGNTSDADVAATSNIEQQQVDAADPVEAEPAKNGAETERANSDKQETTKRFTSIERDCAWEKKADADAGNEVDDENDSQNTSSASLLTDDDQDLIEIALDEMKASCSSSKPPAKAEKRWTLIDLPQDQDEDRIANAPLEAIAKLIGRDLSSPEQENKKDKPVEEKQKEPKKATAAAAGCQLPTAATREQEYEMFRKIFLGQAEGDGKQQSPPATVASKEVKPSSSSAPHSGPSSSASSGSGGRSAKSSRKSSTVQQKDTTVYSKRPHVNHAIHTMMTMGFSNHNGWLTQLLESLNGDIPKALDLLLQHRH